MCIPLSPHVCTADVDKRDTKPERVRASSGGVSVKSPNIETLTAD